MINYISIIITWFLKTYGKEASISMRMKDIEKGTFVNVEIIPNREESIKVFNGLFKDANKEILIILSSANAFFRIDGNIGFKEIEDLAYYEVKAKILIPLRIEIQDRINQFISKYQKIDFRYLQNTLESQMKLRSLTEKKFYYLK